MFKSEVIDVPRLILPYSFVWRDASIASALSGYVARQNSLGFKGSIFPIGWSLAHPHFAVALKKGNYSESEWVSHFEILK